MALTLSLNLFPNKDHIKTTGTFEVKRNPGSHYLSNFRDTRLVRVTGLEPGLANSTKT